MTRPPSLLRALAFDLVVMHLAALLCIAWLVVDRLNATVNDLETRDLREAAHDIATNLHAEDNVPILTLPPAVSARFSSSYGRYSYAVLDADGRVLFSSEPGHRAVLAIDPSRVADVAHFQIREGPALLWGITARDTVQGRAVWIQVAEDMNHRDVLMDEMVSGFVPRAAWLVVPCIVALVLVALSRMHGRLKPLLEAADQAAAIGPSSPHVRLRADNLPVEIRGLAEAVNSAVARLDSAFTAQKEFIENAAHELRTPLSVLRARVDTLGDTPIRRQLDIDIAILSRLVTQLLKVAEVDGLADMVDEALDLARLARMVADYLRPAAVAQGKTLVVEGDAVVPFHGNPEVLGQAITNLIENAIFHTPPGSAVEVAVRAMPSPGVTVSDRGPGVPEAERAIIFQRFWRRDRRKGTGAGLGLAIVQRAVALHRGRVEVSDRPGGGACFTIVFPGRTG
jgi:signal transduction histidine kinase